MSEITPRPGSISIIIQILFIIQPFMSLEEESFITMDWELKRMYHGDVTTSQKHQSWVMLPLR